MKPTTLVVTGSLLAMMVPVSAVLPLASAESGLECIVNAPACVKEVRFLDVKSGCEYLALGTEVIQGSSYRLRGRVAKDRSVNISGLPGTDGWIIATVNSDADLVTLTGSVWGTFLKLFDNVSATVYGSYSGHLENGLFVGHATGSGTGEYDGYLLEADLQQVPLSALPGGDPCPGGSVTGLGQTVDSTFRIDPHVHAGVGE